MILPLVDRDWYDVAIVIYIILFLYLKAYWIDRLSRLGRSLAVTNLILGTAYGWSLIPVTRRVEEIDTVFQVTIAVSVTWCVYELYQARHRGRHPRVAR